MKYEMLFIINNLKDLFKIYYIIFKKKINSMGELGLIYLNIQ